MLHLKLHMLMTMISNSAIFFVISIFFFKRFFSNVIVFLIMIWYILFIWWQYHFLFFQSWLSLLCPLLKICKTFLFSLYLCLHHACLFSILLNAHIIDIELPHGICLLDAQIRDSALLDFRYWVNSNIIISSKGIPIWQKCLLLHVF